MVAVIISKVAPLRQELTAVDRSNIQRSEANEGPQPSRAGGRHG